MDKPILFQEPRPELIYQDENIIIFIQRAKNQTHYLWVNPKIDGKQLFNRIASWLNENVEVF